MKLTLLKVFFASLCLSMVYLVIVTSMQSDLFKVSLAEPWFRTTLWDFYFNIAIISSWVIYKEPSPVRAVLWIIAFVLLGSIATSFYVLLQLWKLKSGEPFEKILLRRS